MKQKTPVLSITLNMLGTVIGAGVFGLPAAFHLAGLLGGTLLFVAALLIGLLLHLLFVEIILAVKGKHRIPGYAGAVLGRPAYWVTLVIVFLKISGTILAYIILGGEFLSMLAHGLGWFDTLWIWQLLFWTAGSIIVFFGLKLVTAVEDELTWLLVGCMLFSAAVLVPFLDWRIFDYAAWASLPAVFGIMFFSVTALPVLPEMVDLARRNRKQAVRGVMWGTLLAGLLSWIFGVSIALTYPGVSGVQDIQMAFPPIFWWLIPAIGVLAIITSFITMSQSLKNMLHVDLRLQTVPAWIAAVTVPLLLYIFVSRDFLATIGFVGGVLTALFGFILCLCAIKLSDKGKIKQGLWSVVPLPLAMILLFIIIQHLLSLNAS